MKACCFLTALLCALSFVSLAAEDAAVSGGAVPAAVAEPGAGRDGVVAQQKADSGKPSEKRRAFEKGGAPGERPRPGDMIPYHVRRFFEMLAQENPQEFQRLMKLRMSDHEQFLKEVKKAMPAPDLEQQRRRFKVERECFQVAAKLREATDADERERLSKELDERAQESLDLVLQRAEEQLEEMQEYIGRLRKDRERLLKARREFYLKAQPPPGAQPPRQEPVE